MRRVQETTDRQIKAEASKLKPITNLFPEMENAQENIEELQTMGIQNKDIRQLLIGKEYTTLETFTIKTRENHTKLKT